jgi:hypothetical protein
MLTDVSQILDLYCLLFMLCVYVYLMMQYVDLLCSITWNIRTF